MNQTMDNLRPILIDKNGKKIRIRMSELKIGDIFEFDDSYENSHVKYLTFTLPREIPNSKGEKVWAVEAAPFNDIPEGEKNGSPI